MLGPEQQVDGSGAGLLWEVACAEALGCKENMIKMALTLHHVPQLNKRLVFLSYLVSGIQELFTGGGTGIEMVLALMSPIMCSASLSA